jgi:deoxyribonuclease (pyrimidine dimer)
MVRVNLINPKFLSDQHLIAEYNEILMLEGYVRKYPKICGDEPREYCLGKGHIKFFKNKLSYLHKRHELLKKEMRKRRFNAQKSMNIKKLPKILHGDYNPDRKALRIISKRIMQKLKNKKDFYRYYGEKRKEYFFVRLIRSL